jgi:hypothetical protein
MSLSQIAEKRPGLFYIILANLSLDSSWTTRYSTARSLFADIPSQPRPFLLIWFDRIVQNGREVPLVDGGVCGFD